MKHKVFLTTAVMLAACGLAYSDGGMFLNIPRGGPQALATADYGGTMYSTNCVFPNSAAGVNFSTAVIPGLNDRSNSVRGVFYGVMFSSGSAGSYDFVDVFDSSSSDRAKVDGAIVRLYNTNGSSTTWTSAVAGAASGFSGPPKPIRFNKGLIIRASVATYNLITVLFQKDQ